MSPLRRARVLIAALVAACGSSSRPPAADTSGPIVAAPSTGSKTDCLTDGLWKECSLLYRLDRSGFAVHAESIAVVHEPRLAIAGKRLVIGHGTVDFFVYADTISRSHDQNKLDTALFMSPAAQATLIKRRTLIANYNLLVLMDVAGEALRDRISDAVMAGPPQPPRAH